MSTEFYCEEFPTEQNGKPVQTLKDLLEACPEDSFHFMTPVGYVDLTAQDAGQLRQGAAMPAHAGESGWEIPIPAEKLLQQELVSVLTRLEITQRVRLKLQKREVILPESIEISIAFEDDAVVLHCSFRFAEEDERHELDVIIGAVSVEVISE